MDDKEVAVVELQSGEGEAAEIKAVPEEDTNQTETVPSEDTPQDESEANKKDVEESEASKTGEQVTEPEASKTGEVVNQAEGTSKDTAEQQEAVEKDEDEEVKEKPKASAVPRSKVRSTDPREGVDLAIGESEVAKMKPITVGQMFRETVRKSPDHAALKFKDVEAGVWKEYTYTQYYQLCVQAAKSFLKLGLEDFHSVCILGFNSTEWVVSNMGAMFAGGLACGIYATNGPEACQYVAEHSKANVLVVENQKQLDKILQVRDNLPHLKAIVQYKGKLSEEYPDVYDWEQFMELGKDMEDTVIEEKIAAQKPEQCVLLVYTSGTTGSPKGVMISHDNLTWSTAAMMKTSGTEIFEYGTDHVISYLPLSHIAAQMTDIYLPVYSGATVYFAQPDALKGSLLQTLLEVKPTAFMGVPRVWEKIMERLQEVGANITGIKKKLGDWAKGVGTKTGRNIQRRSVKKPFGYSVANAIVFKKLRERLGFDRCKIFFSGAAPLSRKVHEYFMSLNIPIMVIYGMSENSGPHSFTMMSYWKLGTVGKPISGVQQKIDQPDETGDGEICMYGRHVFMGYLNNEEKSKVAIDDKGWLHTGDIGRVDKDGFLSITGRIKELIITSGGENIAPVPIEDWIKKEVPFLSNVMLIGDKRKYVTCLVTIQCVMNPDTAEPEDDISPNAVKLIAALGSSCTKVSEIVQQKDEKVFKAIQEGLDRANEHAASRAQRVQKFTVLERDFSESGKELGPTLKLKRFAVIKKFAQQINDMYGEEES